MGPPATTESFRRFQDRTRALGAAKVFSTYAPSFALIVIFGLLTWPQVAKGDLAGESCSEALIRTDSTPPWTIQTATLFRHQISFLHVPDSALRHSTIKASEVLGRNSIFIGVQPDAHTYVVAGGHRFDGNFFLHPSQSRAFDALSWGMGVELWDDNGELRQRCERVIAQDEGRISITCSSELISKALWAVSSIKCPTSSSSA